MQCNTLQYNTIQYNTIQYNTIQYNAYMKKYKKPSYTHKTHIYINICIHIENRDFYRNNGYIKFNDLQRLPSLVEELKKVDLKKLHPWVQIFSAHQLDTNNVSNIKPVTYTYTYKYIYI